MKRKAKAGDFVKCVKLDDSAEDLGASGIVLEGDWRLKKGKLYEIESVDFRHIPKYDKQHWTKKEYEHVSWYWTEAHLKGLGRKIMGDIFKLI